MGGRGAFSRSYSELCNNFVLESLRDQRHIIKGVQRKIIDVASTMNLSNTVIRLIKRRSEGDKLVLFGGMAFTFIVILLVVRWIA
jgi:Golgi SNAP receptor complex protein 2